LNLTQILAAVGFVGLVVLCFAVFWRKAPKPGDWHESGSGMSAGDHSDHSGDSS
jgi:hypothetical protein